MIKVLKKSKISSYPSEVTVDELYIGFELEIETKVFGENSIENVLYRDRRGIVYEISDNESESHVCINFMFNLDIDSIVYKVIPIEETDKTSNRVYSDILIEECSVKDLKVEDMLCESNFYQNYISNKDLLLKRGFNKEAWYTLQVLNGNNDEISDREFAIPMLIESFDIIEEKNDSVDLTVAIQNNLDNLFVDYVHAPISAIFVDYIMVKYINE